VLLNRGGPFPRRTIFGEFEKAGFDYILSVEENSDRYNLEELSERFPQVRFIFLKEKITLGEQVNLAARELSSPLLFVLWDDIQLLFGANSEKIAERLLPKNAAGAFAGAFAGATAALSGPLCTVPVIQNPAYQPLPTLSAPVFDRRKITTITYPPVKEGSLTLYPYDGVGVYDREKFLQIGGFDGEIKSPYWQLMDLGFRAYLWGENIRSTQLIRASYDGDPPAPDSSAGRSYKRFYLKNLSPVYKLDCAVIPLAAFVPYLFNSGDGPFVAWEDFSAVRQWVEANKYRFRQDVRRLTEGWEQPEC
jgi:hypothetical protein